jgi:benzoate-CoA ligase family protein
MKRDFDSEVAIPDNLNLAAFYLEDNMKYGRGEKTAVYFQGERYSFNDLCRLTNGIGGALQQLGVGLADRVLLILQDSPEWLAAWFATMKIGGVATHAYTYLLPVDYEYLFSYVQPRVVIVDKTTLRPVREALRHLSAHIVLLVTGDGVPKLDAGEYGLKAMMEESPPAPAIVHANKNNIAFWNFSGGTTGKWKGVPHRHSHGVVGFESFQKNVHYTPDDIVLRAPKLFFHYARDVGMNWPMRAGAAVCLFPERTTAELLFDLIDKYRPTILLNVPTMMRAMLRSDRANSADLSSVRLCLSSGELLSEQLCEEFAQKFDVEVINVHGSAEMYLACFVDRAGEVRPGSSGKIAPLVEVKIVDARGNEVPKGEAGVLWVRSQASGWSYHLEPEKSKATFLGDNWINTNDLFREDEDGYFWFLGRANDLIKVSGIYVAPMEIEKCLEKHPAVMECAVVGIQDADGLTKPKAFIVLKQGYASSNGTAKELSAYCKQTIGSFKIPRFIEFVAELPKTGQGKIDKRQLQAQVPAGSEKTIYAFTAL